jgi:UDP:flavonoid glycosyltransferase YjiC (YdhE family)
MWRSCSIAGSEDRRLRFALASYGTRGDVEPNAALGKELQQRGHEVVVACPPDQVPFVESVGLSAIAYGPDSRDVLTLLRTPQTIRHPIKPLRQGLEHASQVWAQINSTLKALGAEADVLVTGANYQEAAANVAEHYDIPLVAWHHAPMRPNGQLVPHVPALFLRSAMRASDWVQWRWIKSAEDLQRRELALPKVSTPASRRMAERGSLEIQTYDDVCFPGLAAEWGERRPLVGALTLELPTEADDEVRTWIAAGTPPIYFGLGSMLIESFTDMASLVSAVCAQLGERALICSGATELLNMPSSDNVKIVPALRHTTFFPACRAVVHHGGSGTTAAALRAGVPMLVLPVAFDQPMWARQIKRLKVGRARPFRAITHESLVADLQRVRAPEYLARASEVSTRTTKPSASIETAADLIEGVAG